jgi:aprataxin
MNGLLSVKSLRRHIRCLPLRVLQAMGDWPDWRYGLLRASQRPENQLYSDQLIVIMADDQPKARFHYLVLPREPIDTVEDLQVKHIPLLKHMIEKSEDFIEGEIKSKSKNSVRMGFHIIPTFIRLHLHLISEDFDSKYMKSAHTWGSFTTDFLMQPRRAISLLEERGKIEINAIQAADLRGDNSSLLFCHSCLASFSTLKDLKEHITFHDKDKEV